MAIPKIIIRHARLQRGCDAPSTHQAEKLSAMYMAWTPITKGYAAHSNHLPPNTPTNRLAISRRLDILNRRMYG